MRLTRFTMSIRRICRKPVRRKLAAAVRNITRTGMRWTGGGHAELLAALRDLKGFVLLSGYPDELYDAALPDWRRVQIRALADGARERTEVLWINPACVSALEREGKAMQQLELLVG
jgi:hypothetical protein